MSADKNTQDIFKLKAMFPKAYRARDVIPMPNPVLTGYHKTETLVIGGGLTGLTTALELARKGHKVILCEAGKIGDGPSGRSGGQVIPGFDWGMSEMAAEFGEDLARNLWKDVENARTTLHERIDQEKDKCDSQQGVIVAAMNAEHMKQARAAVDDLKAYSYKHATLLDEKKIRAHINSPAYKGGYIYEDARHINPEKYIRHLTNLCIEAGVIIAENSPVTSYFEVPFGSYCPVGYSVQTPMGHVSARNVVIACGANFHRPAGLDHRILPNRFETAETVIIATEILPEDIRKQVVPGTAAWYDMRHSMNYARIHNGRLLFGGADAISKLHLDFSIAAVKDEMYETLPALKEAGIKIDHIWTGTVDVSKTMLPGIRCLKRGLYEASGFSGHGLVLTGLAGEAIAEDILSDHQGERLARISQIAPENYSNSGLIAKIQMAGAFLPSILQEKLSASFEKHDIASARSYIDKLAGIYSIS